MKITFPAKYEREVDLPVALAETTVLEIFSKLGWKYRGRRENIFSATTQANVRTWGDIVEVESREASVLVRSECTSALQCIDWRKNRSNVKRFLFELKRIGTEQNGDANGITPRC